jgi:hypothetical protein
VNRLPIPSGDSVHALDADHYYTLFVAEWGGPAVGAIVYHRKPDGSWCGGAIKWAGEPSGPYDQARWTLHSLEPLHVEPSIKCGTCEAECGDSGMSHGWIRGDRWEPAGQLPAWATE